LSNTFFEATIPLSVTLIMTQFVLWIKVKNHDRIDCSLPPKVMLGSLR